MRYIKEYGGLNVRRSAGLAIIYKNMVLLAKSAGRKDQRSWGIPKGGIEKGEDKITAAIRETYEELGIRVKRNMVNTTEREFFVNAKKFGYVKYISYFVVEIDDLSQIGLKDLKVPKGQLDPKEISNARFMTYREAVEHSMISQLDMVRELLSNGLIESKTIGNKEIESNQEPNPAQQGENEDDRLHLIRRYKAKIQDFKSYWDDRISSGN
jgi:8-oxo-dGTP pyrophosphatase MutT (NUDIX family)